jgi:hypothetical protein
MRDEGAQGHYCISCQSDGQCDTCRIRAMLEVECSRCERYDARTCFCTFLGETAKPNDVGTCS